MVFKWLIREKGHFSFFIILSFLTHLALFSLVIILGPEGKAGPSSPSAMQARDFQVFRESLQEFAVNGHPPKRLVNALMAISEEDIRDAFLKAPKLDDRLTEREKAGIYKMMIAEAVANFKEGAGERSALDMPLNQYFGSLREMPSADPSEDFSLVQVNNALDESARLFRLSKEKAQALESLSLLAKGIKDRSDEVKLQDDEGHILLVPGEYFYRESPYLQFVAMGAKLYYVIKGFPELPVAKTSQDKAGGLLQGPRTNLSHDDPSPNIQVVLIPSFRARVPAHPPIAAKPSLVLPAADAEQILDGLMTLPIEEQVRTFNKEYLQIYDPDSPGLALLTRAFIYRNLGMVFILTNDCLSRGFDFLEELYYDNISLDELVPYALKNPESRTGAEILLCLAASYEFERRAIIALDESLDVVKQVLANPSNDRFYVYNKSIKAYVLREVYRDLAAELRSRNFASLESVLRKYRDEQIKIYDLLTALGGEINGQARYALGSFYWHEGQADLALDTWKDIDPAFSTGTLNKLRKVMADSGGSNQLLAEINDILAAEASSERAGLLDRIKKFNKWKNR